MQESADETTERAFDAEGSQRRERIIELKRKEKELADLLERKRDWLSFRHKQVLKLGATASDKTTDFLKREQNEAAKKIQRRWRLHSASNLLKSKRRELLRDTSSSDNTSPQIPVDTAAADDASWDTYWFAPATHNTPTPEPPTRHTDRILESLQMSREISKQAPHAPPRPPQFETAQKLLDDLYAQQAETQPLMRLAKKVAAIQQYLHDLPTTLALLPSDIPTTPAIPPPANPTTVRQLHLAELRRARLPWYKLGDFEEMVRECERTMGEDEGRVFV